MTTKRQRSAVEFCEEWLDITFDGDINDFNSVSNFLSMYLEDAKITCRELTEEYNAYKWERMMA